MKVSKDESVSENRNRKASGDNHQPITKMSSLEAKAYFREAKHYVNFDLPPYFNFDDILLYASSMLINKNLNDICLKDNKGKPRYPGNYSDVNYVVLSNKDGGFAWRPLQIIHPVLYADLVNVMTEEKAWSEIINLFHEREKTVVECISLPLQSKIEESNRAVQVSNWWDKVEQESLRKSLDYKFMFQTDIANCYGSIYTHSLEWALEPGGRKKIKADRSGGKAPKNLGTEIDFRLRQMNQNQTIGIPQGSVLMDFTAEIVLAATDIELADRIKDEIADTDFAILRYRDDYRVFSNEYQTGHEIMKLLNNVLYKWNMTMNIGKTSETSDIIASSVKSEKMEEIYTAPIRQSYQKVAMRIYMLSKKHPNAGLVARNLTDYFDRIQRLKKPGNFDYEVVVAIVTMIAYYSPRYIAQVASIITTLIEQSGKDLNRKRVISKIVNKFKDIPNTELIDVWLQRITGADNIRNYKFNSAITKVALKDGDNSQLWNSQWLRKNDKSLIDLASISNLAEDIDKGTFSPIVSREEFELYRSDYQD